MRALLDNGPRRIRQMWTEMTYAQRRLFEIRTGIPVAACSSRSRALSVAELERLFALEGPEEPGWPS